MVPSAAPTTSPSAAPSMGPTDAPSTVPTTVPTEAPSWSPSESPSVAPSVRPRVSPSAALSLGPTDVSTPSPSVVSTVAPSWSPSGCPTMTPSLFPSAAPSMVSLVCTLSFSFVPSLLFQDSVVYFNGSLVGKNIIVAGTSSCAGYWLYPLLNGSSVNDVSVVSPIKTYVASGSSVRFAIWPGGLDVGYYSFSIVAKTVGGVTVATTASVKFQVVSLQSPLPAPVISMVWMTDTGADIMVQFDIETDYGGLSSSKSWSCNKLLSFTGNMNSTCNWMNTTTIYVTLPIQSTLLPLQDSITLIHNKLGSKCDNTLININCSIKLLSSEQTKVISMPYHPITPIVSLKAPSLISACETSFTIDPSRSSGNSGRDWLQVIWYIKPINTTCSYCNELSSNLSMIGKTDNVVILSLPFDSLLSSYNITLTLINFLYQQNTASIIIKKAIDDIPYLSIAGDDIITMKVSDSLSVSAYVTTPSCMSSSAYVTQSVKWTLYKIDNTNQLMNVTSTSKTPLKYVLPSNVLTRGSRYQLTVCVSMSTTTSTSIVSSICDSIVIDIITGSIIAKISGASERYISTMSTILDASMSYDESDATKTRLSYNWTCIMTSGVYFGTNCDSTMTMLSNTAIIVNPILLLDSVSYVYSVVVYDDISDDSDTRTSSSYEVTVYRLLLSSSTTTTINATSSLSIASTAISSGESFGITSTITGSDAIAAEWVITSGTTVLTEQDVNSLTPFYQEFTSNDVNSDIDFPLQLADSSVLSGEDISIQFNIYSISTTNTDRRLTKHVMSIPSNLELISSSKVTIVINTPPTRGILTVSPTVGYSLFTDYTLITSNWIENTEDLPLTYTFYYNNDRDRDSNVNSNDIKYMIHSRSSLNTVNDVKLPFTCSLLYVKVYDRLLASSTASTTVIVQEYMRNTSTFTSTMTSLLNNAYNTHNIDQLLALVTAVSMELNYAPTIVNYTVTDRIARDNIRYVMCNYVQYIVNNSDASILLTSYLGSTSYQLFYPYDYMTNDTILTCQFTYQGILNVINNNIDITTITDIQLYVQSMSYLIDIGLYHHSDNTVLTKMLDELVSMSLHSMIYGQYSLHVSSNNLILSLYKELSTLLYDTTTTYTLPTTNTSNRTDAFTMTNLAGYCHDSSRYMSMSIGKWLIDPYTLTSRIKTGIVRSQIITDGIDSGIDDSTGNSTGKGYYTIRLSFLEVQSLFDNVTVTSSSSSTSSVIVYKNETFPICVQYTTDSDRGSNKVISCDNSCKVLTYTNDIVDILCTDISKLCDSDNITHEIGVALDVRQTQIDTTTTILYDGIDMYDVKILITVISILIIIFIVGCLYFIYLDSLHDNTYNINNNTSITDSIMIKEEPVIDIIHESIPLPDNSNTCYHVVIEPIVRYHMLFTLFSTRHRNSRLLQWITWYIPLILCLTVTSVFFTIYYDLTNYTSRDSYQEYCNQFNDAIDCEERDSGIIAGNLPSLCVWSDSTSTCALRPPPSDAVFMILFSTVTLLIVLPITTLLHYINSEYVFKQPNWGVIGIGGSNVHNKTKNVMILHDENTTIDNEHNHQDTISINVNSNINNETTTIEEEKHQWLLYILDYFDSPVIRNEIHSANNTIVFTKLPLAYALSHQIQRLFNITITNDNSDEQLSKLWDNSNSDSNSDNRCNVNNMIIQSRQCTNRMLLEIQSLYHVNINNINNNNDINTTNNYHTTSNSSNSHSNNDIDKYLIQQFIYEQLPNNILKQFLNNYILDIPIIQQHDSSDSNDVVHPITWLCCCIIECILFLSCCCWLLYFSSIIPHTIFIIYCHIFSIFIILLWVYIPLCHVYIMNVIYYTTILPRLEVIKMILYSIHHDSDDDDCDDYNDLNHIPSQAFIIQHLSSVCRISTILSTPVCKMFNHINDAHIYACQYLLTKPPDSMITLLLYIMSCISSLCNKNESLYQCILILLGYSTLTCIFLSMSILLYSNWIAFIVICIVIIICRISIHIINKQLWLQHIDLLVKQLGILPPNDTNTNTNTNTNANTNTNTNYNIYDIIHIYLDSMYDSHDGWDNRRLLIPEESSRHFFDPAPTFDEIFPEKDNFYQMADIMVDTGKLPDTMFDAFDHSDIEQFNDDM